MRVVIERVEKNSAIEFVEKSSGGRLMLCTTMSVGTASPGRASKFGDGRRVAFVSQPLPSM